MSLKLTGVTVDRNAHPHTVFAVLENPAGESVNVQIRFEASLNVDSFTLSEIERLAHEELKRLEA
ncbi:hypothetical protein CY652_08115 [Burkholderia sp. WAC0059]|uniref:hypothetical protein n=1 Tax=Burkholderia sp. WAC0059 TaxID=2066022 RepID=UPI000C7E988F|nr:hypothetical protein [Burkholderia sp. WAC0059]PLZ02878.1 hypothetical protein CY652_08115 [Burkholderia sp. WAC0059]